MAWTTFGALTNPQLPELDTNMFTLAQMGALPCAVSGSANAIVLTGASGTPPVAAYLNYMMFGAVAGATNNSSVTVQYGALPALNAYKDTNTGPVALGGGEIVQNCMYIFIYDSTLNSNAGGFHVCPCTSINGTNITPSALSLPPNSGSSITYLTSNLFTVAFSVIPAATTQDVNVTANPVLVNDAVMMGLPATLTAGLMFNARVPAAGTIAVRAANITGSSIAAFTIIPRLSIMRSAP